MLKPALAAFALAAAAALSAPAEAHDADRSFPQAFGAPFFFDFAHRYDDRDERFDRGREVERHYHYKNGKRIVHAHPFSRGHDHGRGWSDAKRFKDKKDRYVRGSDHDRRDYWRWFERRREAQRHDHRHDRDWRDNDRRREAQRHDGRHDDARDHDHRREAQRQDAREREWRESREADRREYEKHRRDEFQRWQERQRRND